MGNGRTWTRRELDALMRNYPVHGSDPAKWDEPIDRTRQGIANKAMTMGIPHVSRRYRQSQLSDEQHRTLRRVVRALCEQMGVSERVIAHEVAMIAYGRP